jgi:hypothetical protein
MGRVMSRPRKERGVISPYPTVVMAISPKITERNLRIKKVEYSLTRTNHAAAGMD